jgi:uncharacterized 2Fe-2S/4Fe-4S cluster protein (DUF4445 family)
MAIVRVRFEPEGLTVEVPAGAALHEAAAEAGITIAAPCGGLGRCGSCRVRVSGDLRGPGRTERDALGAATGAGVRLACLARVEGPGEVVVTRDAAPGALQIAVVGPDPVFALEPRTGSEYSLPLGVRPMGAAVDLGTTTIAVRVLGLDDGADLGEAVSLNPQAELGADVLTRVSRALAGDADALQRAVTGEVERLVGSLVDRPALADFTLCETVVVGNPTMTHLFLGRDVAPLAAAPYTGALTEEVVLDAAGADMPALGEVRVTIGPAASAFVGADAVAAVVATALAGRGEPALLIDLGPNGEVVLATPDALLATSAAAGPAFEGGGLVSGMRAEAGAVERAWLGADGLGLATVGGEDPRGVCGSGLLDLVAVLLDAGTLDTEGRMHPAGPLADRVTETEGGLVFEVADGVVLAQRDVRALQLAKAAVAVAIDVLLAEAGVVADDVREVLVAGGFGSHLRPASLVALGVVPAAWAERVTFAGNAALAGASAMLVSGEARREAARVARAVRTVSLAGRADFQARYIAALDFPAPATQQARLGHGDETHQQT